MGRRGVHHQTMGVINVFVKPNDQRELVHFGMARKRGCEETNVFVKPNADELARMLRREND